MSKKQQKPKEVQQQQKQSPSKNTKKQKNTSQPHILQTMKNDIDFLLQFKQAQIKYMSENYDIIIFERGMVLAKEKELIDYVGVIINGGAIAQKSKTKYKPNSLVGHSVAVFGLESHRHPQTVTAESDGIMFAVRIEVLLAVSKQQIEDSIKGKIMDFISKETLCHLKGERHFGASLRSQFELIDEKMAQKYVQSCKVLSHFYESIPDGKQRQKFQQDFPIYSAKQKTLLASRHSRPYLLLVIKGEVIVKYGLGLKKETTILQANQLYNGEGFILDHNEFSNLYAGSAQVVFVLVDKNRLMNNFKLSTVVGVTKCCLEQLQKVNEYSWGSFVMQAEEGNSGVDKKEIWSPFRKSFSIQEIPSKKQSLKSSKQPANNKKKQSINVFQTLYQTYSNLPKNKLVSKQTQLTEYKDPGERVPTSTVQKTEYGVEEKGSGGSVNDKLKRLESEIMGLKEQNMGLGEVIRKQKLELLQAVSRVKMMEVFRQINNLKGVKEREQQSKVLGKSENKSVTLKEAFEVHLKNKKLELLVAKCAYKWLSITRENMNKRQNMSMTSLASKSMQKSAMGNSSS